MKAAIIILSILLFPLFYFLLLFADYSLYFTGAWIISLILIFAKIRTGYFSTIIYSLLLFIFLTPVFIRTFDDSQNNDLIFLGVYLLMLSALNVLCFLHLKNTGGFGIKNWRG